MTHGIFSEVSDLSFPCSSLASSTETAEFGRCPVWNDVWMAKSSSKVSISHETKDDRNTLSSQRWTRIDYHKLSRVMTSVQLWEASYSASRLRVLKLAASLSQNESVYSVICHTSVCYCCSYLKESPLPRLCLPNAWQNPLRGCDPVRWRSLRVQTRQ